MKKHTPIFYSNSQNKLFLNASAYELILPMIEYASVYQYRDVFVLELNCPSVKREMSFFIQNGKVMDKKEACTQCMFRLKALTGGKCSGFKPIKKEKPEDFSYLISYLEEKKVRSDKELNVYLEMVFTSFEECVSEFDDLTFHEYRRLISFFDHLDKTIDRLHRLRGWFRKIFR